MNKEAESLALLKEQVDQELSYFLEKLDYLHDHLDDSDLFFEYLTLLHRTKVMFEEHQLKAFQSVLAAMEHAFRAVKMKKVTWNKTLREALKKSAHEIDQTLQSFDINMPEPDVSEYLKVLKPYQKPLWE